ncbi:MAG: PH domain-containing protein [Marmoricola sp.]
MGPTVQLRSRSTQILGAGMVLMSLAGLASAVAAGTDAVLQFGAPLALFGVLGWGAFWEPRVEVSDGGVTIVNTLRTVEIPWPAVQSVDGRYGLRLQTAYGPVNAWGAAAPAGRQRARGAQSAAADAVNERLEMLREAGYLDGAQLERPAPRTVWHTPLIAALVTLGLGTVLLPLLA